MSSARCKALLSWYGQHARDLPWRHTRDPYRIWISEIMLQQTQVKTVLPRYLAWFEIFPDITTLASCSQDAVLKAWEGLGYYRRARFLHAAAQHMVATHDGCFPEAFEDVLALPGIGRSTAGAITSFAYGEPHPVLDGNVKRVLRRWYAEPEATDKQLWLWAQQAMDDSGDFFLWNQVMMELGASVCSPGTPGCSDCPVQGHCMSAHAVKTVSEPKKKVKVQDFHWQVQLYRKGAQVWLVQRPEGGIWGHLWAPPIIEQPALADHAPDHVHVLTHRRLHLYAQLMSGQPEGDGVWYPDAQVSVPTGIRRLLEGLASMEPA